MSKVAINLCGHELTLRSSVTDFSRQDTGPLYDNRYQKHARSLSEPHFNAAIDPTRSWDRLAAGSLFLSSWSTLGMQVLPKIDYVIPS